MSEPGSRRSHFQEQLSLFLLNLSQKMPSIPESKETQGGDRLDGKCNSNPTNTAHVARIGLLQLVKFSFKFESSLQRHEGKIRGCIV
jgi:hypothetical protein